MRMKRLLPVAVVLAALIMMAGFAAAGSVRAQSGTPSPMMDMTAAHPVHIHNGTCATLGSIAWPLNDLSAPGAPMTMMGTPVAGMMQGTPMAGMGMMQGTPMAGMGPVVAESVTIVKVHLADLEKGPFAINAHESLAKIGNYIACGNITGTITGGSLTIQLAQMNKSGLAGVAMLHDNGDGTTTVSLALMKAANG